MTVADSNSDSNPVLASIRRAIPNGCLPGAAADHPQRNTFGVAVSAQEIGVADMVASFTTELEALTGHVHHPATPSAAVEVILQLVRTYAVDTALSWSQEELILPGIWEHMTAAGVAMLTAPVPDSGAARSEALAAQARAQMGLTGAQAGLVDTGSLVLVNGPGRPRLASLLPPVHVALLPTSDLFPSMAHLFTARPNLIQSGSNMVVITGPSRTADIELTLTIGVHGPRHLHVILLPAC